MMKITILLLMVLFSNVQAEEISQLISFERLESSGLSNSLPMQFIINNKGSITYHRIGADRGIKSGFKMTEKINNADAITGSLLSLFDQVPIFSNHEFTLVFITDDMADDFCPPCLMQEDINKHVLNSLRDKNIQLIKLYRHIDGERSGSIQ